jgi:hypothetical protein
MKLATVERSIESHLLPAELPGRGEPALAGDELIAVARGPHHDRLYEAVGLEAGREFGEVGVMDEAARLPGIGIDERSTHLVRRQARCGLLELFGRVEDEAGGA